MMGTFHKVIRERYAVENDALVCREDALLDGCHAVFIGMLVFIHDRVSSCVPVERLFSDHLDSLFVYFLPGVRLY